MSETAVEQRATLIRQRRFLILMSLSMIAFYVLGIQPKQEASVSGVGMTITRPDRLPAALWIIWGWSLWRYAQRVYELLSAIWLEILDDVYAEDRRIALARAKKTANQLAARGEIDEDTPKSARLDGEVTIGPPDPESLQSLIGEKVTHFRDYVPTREGGRLYPTLKANFEWEDGIKWSREDHSFKMKLSRRASLWLRLRAWLHALLRLPAFSEHVVPFLLALAAAVVGIVHGCMS